MVNWLVNEPLLAALAALILLGSVFGALLGYAAIRFKVEGNPISEQVNALLPQTQCGQCGYPGCRPYSEAIAEGDAINKCPPGGEETIQALADLLDVEPQPLDAEHGVEKEPVVAWIREDECIGCTKCLQACPVKAVNGDIFDVSACAGFISSVEGGDCLATGCRARRACPVGQNCVYSPAQAAHHMQFFLDTFGPGPR